MYDLPYHKAENRDVIRAFVTEHPFAFVTGCDSENKPVATQVPVLIEEQLGREVLRGHLMRNTDHHRAFAHNPEVLVVFAGPHTYVSGTWYSNPHTPSTWNYMSVHVRGRIRFLVGADLEQVLRRTSLQFEGNNPDSTTTFDHIPETLRKKYLPAIVAFEIEISSIDTVFKLSQDRDEASYRNIIRQLMQQGPGAQAIASEMEKRLRKQFPG
jgi:transcriptional regulator